MIIYEKDCFKYSVLYQDTKPEAAKIATYGKYDISYYTGKPEISNGTDATVKYNPNDPDSPSSHAGLPNEELNVRARESDMRVERGVAPRARPYINLKPKPKIIDTKKLPSINSI
jgi:hypothetical protein